MCFRSSGSSPVKDSPGTPSPRPDPAFQLAMEAKRLVERVSILNTEDTGMRKLNGYLYCILN